MFVNYAYRWSPKSILAALESGEQEHAAAQAAADSAPAYLT